MVTSLCFQASLDSELTKKGNLIGFMSLCREILTRFITQYFPITIDTKVRQKKNCVSDNLTDPNF